MKTKLLNILFVLCLLMVGTSLSAQDRFEQIKNKLELLTVDNPGLDNTVDLSVNAVSLQEFIRGIANANELNISVDKGLDVQVINNFSNASVADVLLFLAKKYNLDIEFIGNIISIGKYEEPAKEVEKVQEKVIQVFYKKNGDLLTLDLDNDALTKVAKKITDLSSKNIILSPEVISKKVSVYIKDMPFENALEKFAFANGMQSSVSEDGFYLLSDQKKTEVAQTNSKEKKKGKGKEAYKRENTEGFFLEAKNRQSISITAEEAPIDEIVKAITAELDINYYLHSKIQGAKTLNIIDEPFEQILDKLFETTNYTYKKTAGIYLIGERKAEGIRKTTVHQLQNRSIKDLLTFIPGELKKDVELTEFVDLNSIVISGSVPQTNELIMFLEKIDQVVPVVAIDVIILDYRKNRGVTTGINAGLGTEPSGPTQGTILPDANFSFSASSLNNVIGNLNKGSSINLGKVTPNFYLSVQALETDGVIKVRSTPKLATLNGHEAKLSIGNTEYYVEQSNNVIGSQNPQNIITRRFQSVNADLTITITPFVSGNDQITLDISVEQSDFTERISEDAPPGSVTRSFTSTLRVKNNEVILLGGLEEKSRNDSGSGLPLISRIPVLKWIFGRRTKAKSSSQLNIFIKPTVIY